MRFLHRILKARQLRKQEEWCAVLSDQVSSGQHALYFALQKRDQLQAELYLLEPPDQLVRRLA